MLTEVSWFPAINHLKRCSLQYTEVLKSRKPVAPVFQVKTALAVTLFCANLALFAFTMVLRFISYFCHICAFSNILLYI